LYFGFACVVKRGFCARISVNHCSVVISSFPFSELMMLTISSTSLVKSSVGIFSVVTSVPGAPQERETCPDSMLVACKSAGGMAANISLPLITILSTAAPNPLITDPSAMNNNPIRASLQTPKGARSIVKVSQSLK